jgi:hypothetical protein
MVFLQPDMVDLDRLQEPDFALKLGCSIILLEFRVQEAPKNHTYSHTLGNRADDRKYLRVSELLVIDSMTHLKSLIPIQCRPPVAQSQLLNRESTEPATSPAPEPLPLPAPQALHPPPADGFVHPATTLPSPHAARSPLIQRTHSLPVTSPMVKSETPSTRRTISAREPSSSVFTPGLGPSQFQNSLQPRQFLGGARRRPMAFGFNSTTPENIVSLAELQKREHKDRIDVFAVVQTVYKVKRIESIGREKRDLDIIDPSQPRRTILSGITKPEYAFFVPLFILVARN